MIFTVEHGPRFAARGAVGSLSGAIAEGAFCLGFAWSGRRGWPVALVGATAAFAVAAVIFITLPWILAVLAEYTTDLVRDMGGWFQ